MDKEKIFSFYEKMYFREIDEMNTILSRYPVLFAGIAIIINIYVLTLGSKSFLSLHWLIQFIFIIVIAFCSVSLLKALYDVFKTRSYDVFVSLDVIENNRKLSKKRLRGIQEFNEEVSNKNLRRKEIDPNEDTLDDLCNHFVEFSSRNMKVNEEKRKCFHQTIKWIWRNLVLCIVIPLLVASLTVYKDITMSESDIPQTEKTRLKEKDQELVDKLDQLLNDLEKSGFKGSLTNSLSKEKYEEYLKQQAEKANK